MFAPETRGLPPDPLERNASNEFRIPIRGRVRCLNLSTAVGVVVYEAYRRLGAW